MSPIKELRFDREWRDIKKLHIRIKDGFGNKILNLFSKLSLSRGEERRKQINIGNPETTKTTYGAGGWEFKW